MLAADVEKHKEAHRERIQAKAETQDTASLARLLLPGGVLSHEVPTAEQALLNRTGVTKERPRGLPAAADARRWAMAAWLLLGVRPQRVRTQGGRLGVRKLGGVVALTWGWFAGEEAAEAEARHRGRSSRARPGVRACVQHGRIAQGRRDLC